MADGGWAGALRGAAASDGARGAEESAAAVVGGGPADGEGGAQVTMAKIVARTELLISLQAEKLPAKFSLLAWSHRVPAIQLGYRPGRDFAEQTTPFTLYEAKEVGQALLDIVGALEAQMRAMESAFPENAEVTG